MRHRMMGKSLSRTPSHRKAMRRNMASSLFEHGAIRTTEVKAKELRPFVEKLITLARKGDLASRRRVVRLLNDRKIGEKHPEESNYRWFKDGRSGVVKKLFEEIAPRYADRPGGYTRIIRLADRRIGDAGKQVVLQLVEESAGSAGGPATGSRRQRRAEKRIQAARQSGSDAAESPAAAAPAPADQQQAENEPGDQAPEQGDDQAETDVPTGQADQTDPQAPESTDEDEKAE
jgi:large subunit ribosomal protein L17